MKDVIATAATNGSIALYRDFRYDRTLQEHHRQVNRLAFNPADGRLLLSASQDGNVKLWDLRERKSRSTFQGKSEAVRDVQFNAANAVEFAAAYENGSIQRWDYRKPNACERKISNAHQGPVYSVAWHPDGKHCASGGRDKTVKVWDFYADPRRKSKHTLYTATSLGRVVWRPGGVRTTELATCSIGNDYRIHLWDLKRPYMPSYVLMEHSNAITGLQFRDEEVLWSAGKDGLLVMHDVVFGHMPIADLPMVAVGWNSENEFTFATQRRKRVQKFGGGGPGGSGVRVHLDTDDYQIRTGSSSAAEDRSKKKESRSSSFKRDSKPAQQISALDALLEKFQPAQATAKVNLPVFDFDKFEFLAKHYVTTLLDGRNMSIRKACERNAKAAMCVGEFRTAKTWQVLGYLLTREDEAIAEKAERERVKKAQEAYAASSGGPGGGAIVARRLLGLGGGQYINPGGTPLARPVPDTPKPTPTPTPVQLENMINIDEALLLPPAAFKPGTGSVPSSTASTDGDSSPRILADEDEGGEGGSYVDVVSPAGEHGGEGSGESREGATSPRPILSVDTGRTGGQYRHRHTRHDNYQRRDSNNVQPSFDSSAAFLSTSGEDASTSLDRERRGLDNPPSSGSYEQPVVIRTRPRQYSIGLMSEQTSGSYEERMLGSERDDNESEGGRGMSLHAIQEEREWGHNSGFTSSTHGYNNNGYGIGSHYDSVNGSTSNVTHNTYKAGIGSQHHLPVHHPASNNSSTLHLDNQVNNNAPLMPSSWYRGPAPPSMQNIPKLEVNGGQPIPPQTSSSTPRPAHHQRPPYASQTPPPPSHTAEETVPPWSPRQLIPQLTEYYTQQGDVQFLATLINLLNNRYPIPKRQVDEWVEGYIQLLHRKGLLRVAAEVVKWTCSELVKAKGQTETFVAVSCGWCGRSILGEGRDGKKGGFWYCDGCKRRQDGCVICRKGVRGRWVACGICGHGGHEGCLRGWFFGGNGEEREEGEGEKMNNGKGRGEEAEEEGGGDKVVVEGEVVGDEEAMECCPAVGCTHECLPRYVVG